MTFFSNHFASGHFILVPKKLHFQDVFKKMVLIRFLMIITQIYCSGEGPFGFGALRMSVGCAMENPTLPEPFK